MAQTLSLQGVTMLPKVGAFKPAVLDTSGGLVETRVYEAEGSNLAVLWLGDDVGGFDSPADGLFDRMAEAYVAKGVCSLRMQYRNPRDLPKVGLDGLLGAYMLQRMEMARIVVVAWGVGTIGAIEAAGQFPTVAAVALLAPRGLKANGAANLARPLLILHGTADTVTPTQASRDLLAQASEPKRIVYFQGADHGFGGVEADLERELGAWIDRQLGVGEPQGSA